MDRVELLRAGSDDTRVSFIVIPRQSPYGMVQNIQRRDIIKGAAGAGLVGVAGCTQLTGDGGNGGDGDGGPDTLIVIGYPQSGVQLFKDFYSEFGTDIPILVTDGLKDPKLPEKVGNSMANVEGTAPAPKGPGADQFAQMYQDEYGSKPGVFNAHTFDSSAILMLANAAAGKNDGTAVRDQMTAVANPKGDTFTPDQLPAALDAVAAGQDVNYQGASSPTDFDERGDMVAVTYSVFAFENKDVKNLRSIDFKGDAPSKEVTPPAGTGRTVKVGILLPLTGDLAPLGKPMRDAGKLAVKKAKENTSNLTIDARVEDTQTNPQAGISAANALVSAGYPGVNGPASSGVNIQVSKQVWEPNKTVGCSPSSTSPKVTTLDDNDYVWRTAPSDALQGQVLAQVSYKSKGARSAATMYVNNSYGQSLSQSFADSFKKRGGSIKTQVPFAKKKSSYTSELEKALK